MFERALRDSPDGILVVVDARPGARETRITGFHDARGAIRIDVAARPERGMANRELAAFLASLTGGTVSVVRGAGSRHKTLLVRGVARGRLVAAIEGTR